MAQLTDQLGYLTETTLRKLAGEHQGEPATECMALICDQPQCTANQCLESVPLAAIPVRDWGWATLLHA